MAKTISQYLLPLHILILLLILDSATAATWCVARTDVGTDALQRAIDYACGSGADCAPILSGGLCYLPNTLQSHASFAFNSYSQRTSMAPGSCDFAGTAVAAATDPSYGSCVYPSSLSTAGGAVPSTTVSPTGTSLTPTRTPITNVPTTNPFFTPPTSFTNGGGYGGGSVPFYSGTTHSIDSRISYKNLLLYYLLCFVYYISSHINL